MRCQCSIDLGEHKVTVLLAVGLADVSIPLTLVSTKLLFSLQFDTYMLVFC